MANEIQIADSEGFLQYLNDGGHLNELYDIVGLTDECKSIESHYFKLRRKLSFLPHYKWVIKRITNYSQSVKQYKKNQHQTDHLLAAVKSRLFAIDSNTNYVVVTKLEKFFEIIKGKIIDINNHKNKEHIEGLRDDFKNALDEKIKAADVMMTKTVQPMINKMVNEADGFIKELVKELNDTQNQAKEELGKAEENEKTLRKKFWFHAFTGTLKLVGSVLKFTGPQGIIAGAIIDAGVAVAETVGDSTLTTSKVNVPTKLIADEVKYFTNHARKNFGNFVSQYHQLCNILKMNYTKDLEPIEKKLGELANDIDLFQKATNSSDNKKNPELVKQLQSSTKEIINVIKTIKKNEEINPKALKTLNRMENVLTFGQDLIGFYGKLSEDDQNVDNAQNEVEQVKQAIQVMKQHEWNIYNIMIPEMQKMEQALDSVSKQTADKTHVELDLTKFSIQIMLNDVKHQFNQISRGFMVSGDLEHCIRKIKDAITTVIEIHDRIDSYREKQQLANLIADINIATMNPGYTYTEIDKMIDKSLILEQYEMGMQALKQHKFPFVENYLKLEDITEKDFTDMSGKIDKVLDDIRTSDATLSKQINAMTVSEKFSKPLYTWSYRNFKNKFNNLLNGDQETFTADINYGLRIPAVKFSSIWIKFLLKDETKKGFTQENFDVELKKFKILMEMKGNEYYSCEDRIYSISLEKPIEFFFTLQNNTISELSHKSGSFDVLNKTDLFLSPYTTWGLMIEPISFDNTDFSTLRGFADKIFEITLGGEGSYFGASRQFIHETCSEKLDQYYRLDSIMRNRK